MSAWGYEERGENWSGKRRVVAFDHDLVDRYLPDPDALPGAPHCGWPSRSDGAARVSTRRASSS